jgi:hypothetical protein
MTRAEWWRCHESAGKIQSDRLLAGKPDKAGAKASPTLFHMTKTWIETFEREHEKARVDQWLP